MSQFIASQPRLWYNGSMKLHPLRWLIPVVAAGLLLVVFAAALGVPGVGSPEATPAPPQRIVLPPGGNMLVDRDNFNGADRGIPNIELASHLDISWAAINPQNCDTDPLGCTDFSVIEDRLNQLSGQQVTLVDGQVVTPRPVWLSLPRFWSQGQEVDNVRYCDNYVPNWLGSTDGLAPNYSVLVTRTVNGQAITHTELVPRLDSPALQDAYATLIQRLGEAYGSDPRVAGLFIANGYDNETNLIARWCGVSLDLIANCSDPNAATCLISAYSGGEYDRFVRRTIEAFHQAFPRKPVYLLLAPAPDDWLRCNWVYGVPGQFTGIRDYDNRHIGIGFNGMRYDVPSFIRRPPPEPPPARAACSSFQLMLDNRGILPIKLEPSQSWSGVARHQIEYWSWLAGMGPFWPDLIDTQPSWFCVETEAEGSCRATPPATTPSSQLRVFNTQYGFPLIETPRSGSQGDFSDWIERQLGNTASNARDLWTVFHRTEFPHTGSYCRGFCEGFDANFDHFLAVVDGAYTVRCGNSELPCYDPNPLPAAETNIYSRFAGRMDGSTLSFAISNTLSYYGRTMANVTIRIAYVNDGESDFTITFPAATGSTTLTVDRTAAGGWAWFETTQTVRLANVLDGAVLRLGYTGPAPQPTLHMIWIDVNDAT